MNDQILFWYTDLQSKMSGLLDLTQEAEKVLSFAGRVILRDKPLSKKEYALHKQRMSDVVLIIQDGKPVEKPEMDRSFIISIDEEDIFVLVPVDPLK